eukprot:TRINITY_DN4315_c0_g2_i5.p2 TRINITY_DN4315_c0_g2~~TRINITY_DN4315_c0_g2_i5.p2  ORF type:complete len:247 (-),score=3.86 TRINITY_DN4315_c0_g2_i5:210-950(-)
MMLVRMVMHQLLVALEAPFKVDLCVRQKNFRQHLFTLKYSPTSLYQVVSNTAFKAFVFTPFTVSIGVLEVPQKNLNAIKKNQTKQYNCSDFSYLCFGGLLVLAKFMFNKDSFTSWKRNFFGFLGCLRPKVFSGNSIKQMQFISVFSITHFSKQIVLCNIICNMVFSFGFSVFLFYSTVKIFGGYFFLVLFQIQILQIKVQLKQLIVQLISMQGGWVFNKFLDTYGKVFVLIFLVSVITVHIKQMYE